MGFLPPRAKFYRASDNISPRWGERPPSTTAVPTKSHQHGRPRRTAARTPPLLRERTFRLQHELVPSLFWGSPDTHDIFPRNFISRSVFQWDLLISTFSRPPLSSLLLLRFSCLPLSPPFPPLHFLPASPFTSVAPLSRPPASLALLRRSGNT